MTGLEAMAPPTVPAARAWQSVGISLATMVVAFFVVALAGEYVGLGPLDLATANLIALGLWAAAPVLGGLLERHAGTTDLTRAATFLGALVGACVALFFIAGSGTGDYVCSFDLGAVPRLIGVLLVGGFTGAGIGLGFFVSGVAARRAITLAPGVVVAAVIVLATSLAAKELFYEAVRCLP
jgi:hypothetical protein